ncbi:Protein kinase domain [Trypanosoma melophagium]|uniref:Protein kinase domain n=1 Tax=Trypanosoma melophagium TaxID=715481 RepID=UPI003519ED4B|nr:Protein kinase domain [Trypanosoma melophagium]
MALASSVILSDETLEQMSREELLEQLRKLQQSLVLLTSTPNDAGDDRRQRQQRGKSGIQRLSVPLFENHLTQQGQHRQTKLQWCTSEDGVVPYNQRLSSSLPDDGAQSTNGHTGEVTSILSLLSGSASAQLSSLPAAIPVGQIMNFQARQSCDVRSFSFSNASMTALAPARLTDKLNVVRNEAGNKCINNYQIIKELGRGSCGKVHLAYDVENTSLVAIKQVRRVDTSIRIGGQTAAQMQFRAFQREVAVMKKLRHKNIVPLYEVIDDPNAKKVYLVMMYVDRGPIAHLQCQPSGDINAEVCTPIDKNLLASYTRQILSGLEYLHEHKVVHRDIKPENILVNRNGQAYLSDFGVAEVFDNNVRERLEQLMQESMAASRTFGGNQYGATIQGTKGTMLFIAPELWRGDRSYAKPVDMWALGVTLYILLTGKLPFCTLDDIMDPSLPVIPTTYGTEWADLLRGMLNRDPGKRLTVSAARAMLKALEKKNTTDDPINQTPLTVTEDEVSHALTLAQKQKDESDVEWLLGQHGGADELEIDEDVGIGYGLPCVFSPNEKKPTCGAGADQFKSRGENRKTSPPSAGILTLSPPLSPLPEQTPVTINTTNSSAAVKGKRGSLMPLDAADSSHYILSTLSQPQVEKTAQPTRSASWFTLDVKNYTFQVPQAGGDRIPEETNSDPLPTPPQRLEEPTGETVGVKNKNVKGGIFSSLRDALAFSRSKKLKKGQQDAVNDD